MLTDPYNPPTVDFETISDEGQVGDGTEFVKNSRVYAVQPGNIPLGGQLNTESAARLFKRFLGGTVTDTLVATGVYDHVVIMQTQAQGIIPALSTIPIKLGGSDFIWSSCAVDQYSIQQTLNRPATYSAQLISTGHHRRFRDVYRSMLITVTSTGGTFTITFDGQVTSALAFNANAAAVLAALEALSNIAPGDVTTSGALSTGMTIAFTTTGAYKNANVPAMTVNGALLTTPTAGITIAPTVPLLVLPQPPEHHYMHGSALLAVMNDGTVRDFTDEGTLSYSIQMANNIQVLGLPGDDFMIADDFSSGAISGFIRRGRRTAVPSMKLFLDANMPEYYARRKNLDITSWKITNRGEQIAVVAGTAYHHEFEVEVPFSKIQSMASDAEGDMGAKTFSLLPTKDPVSLGIVKARIRNGSATLV
jgi:hypothetical protein